MSGTVTKTESEAPKNEEVEGKSDNRLTLKLRGKKKKKVNWEEGTVDNEGLGKKKSKCCCIYKKPRAFGESSSSEDDDDECKDCIGHIKLKT